MIIENADDRWALKARRAADAYRGTAPFRAARVVINGLRLLRNALNGMATRVASAVLVDGLGLCPYAPALHSLDRKAQRLFAQLADPAFDRKRFAALGASAEDLFQRTSKRHPGRISHLQIMSNIRFRMGDTKGGLDLAARAFTCREQRLKAKGLDKAGYRLLPTMLLARTIGNLALLENYVRADILKGGKGPRLVMTIHPDSASAIVSNPCLLDYWKKYIDIVEDRNLVARYNGADPDLFIDPHTIEIDGKVVTNPHAARAHLQSEWEAQGRGPLFTLDPAHEAEGWAALANEGISRDDWFVCLHARAAGYNGADPFRDTDPTSYLDAIRTITGRGGWVIRMGDPSMAPLPDMEHVIDYAHSPMKSDRMDVFLSASCRFFIGTSSGLYHLADYFGRPFIMTNLLPTCAVFFGPDNLFIPKRLTDRTTGREITMSEMMSEPLSYMATTGEVTNVHGLAWQDNTAEELRAVVEEMLDRLDGKMAYSDQDEQRQAAFRDVARKARTLAPFEDMPLRCRIGRDFLNSSTL